MVGPAGLEPARLAAGVFKTPAYTIPPRARGRATIPDSDRFFNA